MLAPTRFRFLSVEHDLDAIGWDDPAVPLLWRYNLHYFDDLSADGAASRSEWHRALLDRWLAENPPGHGTGWAPYPSSLRIVNWIKWFNTQSRDGQPKDAWLHLLAVQVRCLASRLEWHLLGNHLFANAKALVHAGLFFKGEEADGWLRTGVAMLRRELPEQVLADGGHFERSPMYHALAVEDVLDLINVCRRYGADRLDLARSLQPELAARVPGMLRWLHALSHPDGTLARFNDCAEGIAPATRDILRLAADMGLETPSSPLDDDGARLLLPSGYARMARGGAVLLADVAPIEPAYLPGHAHADTLSYELSLGQRQVVVNRGTSEYGSGPRRQLERGTSAHSTVHLGGHDSSEVWSGFRVGRRARVRDVDLHDSELTAAHDGYRFLPGSPLHRRRWRLQEHELLVEDKAMPSLDGISRHHLAPGLALQAESEACWLVLDGDRVVARAEVAAGAPRVTQWLHAQRFGILVPAQTLELGLQNGCASLRWHW